MKYCFCTIFYRDDFLVFLNGNLYLKFFRVISEPSVLKKSLRIYILHNIIYGTFKTKWRY